MKKSDDALKALLDREEIRELPARYCDCVWRNDIPGLVKLFTPDGEFTMTTPTNAYSARGHAELLEFYVRGLGMTPRPYIHNVVVELGKKGRAVGRCYLELRSAKRDMAWLGAGHYVDHYAKQKGVWKFARREFTALRMEDSPSEPTITEPANDKARAPAAVPRARKAAVKAPAAAKPAVPKAPRAPRQRKPVASD